MRLIESHLLLIVLSTLATGTAACLLMLSGWFIAAAALAGAAGTALVFNYAVPATAIRLLAVIRITSGYASNYLGHSQLLSRLTKIRVELFDSVMGSGRTPLQSNELDRLERHSLALANHTLTVVTPWLVFTILIIANLAFFAVYLPSQWFGLLLFFVLMLLFLSLFKHRYTAILQAEHESEVRYRNQLHTDFKTAALWSFRYGESATKHVRINWTQKTIARKDLELTARRQLRWISSIAVIVSLLSMPHSILGSPLALILPLMLLAIPDWFGNLVRAQSSDVAVQLAKRELQLKESPVLSNSSVCSPTIIDLTEPQEVQLHNFRWQREPLEGRPVTAHFNRDELTVITGDSGCGKTSLLMAMAGLLDFKGNMLVHQSCERPHYCEQSPKLLADTLRNNLLIADPAASDSRLQNALEFAELSHLIPALSDWMGEQGRMLSGGERKRLGLARAWLTGSRVWLLDEPFEGVDKQTAENLAIKMQNAARDRIIIVVSHRRIANLQQCRYIALA